MSNDLDADLELARLRLNNDSLRHEADQLRALLIRSDAALARIVRWTYQHGDSLIPRPPWTDSYGDGMRAAKQQVSDLLSAHPLTAHGIEGSVR